MLNLKSGIYIVFMSIIPFPWTFDGRGEQSVLYDKKAKLPYMVDNVKTPSKRETLSGTRCD